jgi:thiol:disulfide interchange protein DsbD
MESVKLRPWAGRVALVAIAWLASPMQSAVQAADFLDPEDAFRFSATVAEDGRTVAARFSIADGYYLYHERFAFIASDGVQLGTPQYPPGKVKFDETFNKEVLTYRGDVVVRLPVESGSGAFTLTTRLQGCADRGLCYPPEQRTAQLLLTGASNAAAPPGAGTASAGSEFVTATEQGRIDSALKSRSLLAVLPIFFVLGLLLSFTPCVLPMLPILSSRRRRSAPRRGRAAPAQHLSQGAASRSHPWEANPARTGTSH